MTKKTWPAWMYHPSKGAKLIKEFDGEYPEGWYDCPKKAFEAAAKPAKSETVAKIKAAEEAVRKAEDKAAEAAKEAEELAKAKALDEAKENADQTDEPGIDGAKTPKEAAKPAEVVELTRGQKGAATRKANAEAKAKAAQEAAE